MAIIRDIQRSRPLQILITIIIIIIFYFSIKRSNSIEIDDDSFTNEELNNILRGHDRWENNDFNINRRELPQVELTEPFKSTSALELTDFVSRGNAMISHNKVRLVSDKPHQLGHIFSRELIPLGDSFELELEFNINGKAVKNGMYGDGMGVWITDEVLQGGEVFGCENRWNGLLLFIDTYQNSNDKSHKNTGFPYASLQLNQGLDGYYDKDSDGVRTEVAGCSLSKVYNVRTGRSKMRLIYLRESGYLSVDFDIRANGKWKNCFTIDKDVSLPDTSFIGLSGATGDLSHNVDIYKLELYLLYDDEGNPIQSIELINKDLQNHLQQEEKAEQEELDDVIQSKQRRSVNRRQTRAKNSQRRRRTLTRLRKLEKRLKLKIAQENRAKYNGHDNVFSYIWSVLKSVLYWLSICIGLYIGSIIIRAYLDKRRNSQKSYYKGGLL